MEEKFEANLVEECFVLLMNGDESWPHKVDNLQADQAMRILCRVITRFCAHMATD